MERLLVIGGPTATGKTALGIRLAKKFQGEIISADSRQVYREMDIITGKDTDKFSIFHFQFSKNNFRLGYYLINGIRVWLYDLARPDYRFNVADYVACARAVVEDIWRRGKRPLLVGGTGFYLRALVDGVDTINIKPDWLLRGKLANYPVAKLAKDLQQLDPQKWRQMNASDRQNPRRLIRALEIASHRQPPWGVRGSPPRGVKSDQLFIGLTAPFPFLYQQIDRRVEQRVAVGAEQEAKRLFKKYGQNSVLGVTIGYQQWQDFFAGRVSRQQALRRWQSAEHAYARRQVTWFKRDRRIKWFDIRRNKWQDKAEAYVNRWLAQNAS